MAKISNSNETAAGGYNKLTPRRVLSKVGKPILIFATFIGYAFFVPLFLLLMSPLYLYRFVAKFLAKLLRPDLIRIVCTRDGIVGMDDVTKKCQCVINIMLTYRGVPDLEQIRHIFQTKVIDEKDADGNQTYEKFTQFWEMWIGYDFWKKEKNFMLQDHIRFCEETEAHSLAGNNNEDENIVTEEDFIRIVGPITTRPFPKGMSPWEILIVRNFVPSPGKIHTNYVPTIEVGGANEKTKYVLILRVHHAISDGFSLMKMIMTNLSDEPMDKIPAPLVKELRLHEKIMTYLGILVLSPYYHLKQFVIDVDRNFWHMKESKLTNDWLAIRSEKISFSSLKQVSKSQKVSTTAVLLTGFGSGIRTFLKETGQEDKMPKVMTGFSPMPWKNHPMNGLVNHWTLGFMAFPIGSPCPKKRLRVADKSIRLLKTSPILFTNFGTVPIFLGPPSWITDYWARNWMSTMILSNFPGPNFPVKSFGRNHLEDVTVFLPQMRGCSSLGVSFLSYNGGVRLTATIDKAVIATQEKADFLNECINKEVKNLIGLASEGEYVV